MLYTNLDTHEAYTEQTEADLGAVAAFWRP